MTIEESGNHCAGCGAGIRSYLDGIDKATKEANDLSKKNKVPMAVYENEEGFGTVDAFFAYANGYNVKFIVSNYL